LDNFEQAQLLRNAGASLEGLDPVWFALFQENQEQLQNVLERATNYDDIQIDQLCLWAIKLKKPKHLETILKDGRFQYIKKFSWVMHAANNGGLDYLQILASTPEFKEHAQDDVKDDEDSRAINDALEESIANNKPKHLQILLEAGVNPNRIWGGEPTALIAIQENSLECLKVLLEHGLKPSLEFEDEEGHSSTTLALWAFCNGHNEAHRMLMNYWSAPQAAQQQTAAAPADQKKSAETTHKMEE
jgi:hypothetical protein